MRKFTAPIAVVVAVLALPALASAAPTATHISTPSDPAYVTGDKNNPNTLHVAGTTSGGTGNVDLRCYFGTNGPLLASSVPVSGGAFATDVTLTKALLLSLGKPQPFCTLRAVPTGTVPAAPPNAASPWEGPRIGFGFREIFTLGADAPNQPDLVDDYFIGRAQSAAFSDYLSVASCGLCDTFLFAPGTKAPSNAIWWSNAALFDNPTGVTTRTSVEIDGGGAYSGVSAYYQPNIGNELANNPGFPANSVTDTVDPISGNLTIDEHSPFSTCAPDPAAFPASDANCASFAPSGVVLDRQIRQTDDGLRITIVDHWKSVDGKPHQLDAIYDDWAHSDNGAIAGRGGKANLTWTQDGFTGYPANAQVPVPPTVPATMLVKTDASTPDLGDNVNPFGAMTFGSQPAEIKAVAIGLPTDNNNEWQAHYKRTIPAGGEISIAFAYSHGLALGSVKAKVPTAESAVAAPSVAIDSPADGAAIDAATAHVTGTAASADGKTSVKVNGVAATFSPDGHWTADVPLSDGANTIAAVASNAIGVTTTAIRSVTHTPPAASPTVPATSSAPLVIAAKPVRCVVPKLRGKTLVAAKRLLKHAHCRLGKVTRRATNRVKPGRVVATRLKAGTRHRAGTRVRVTIAKARRL